MHKKKLMFQKKREWLLQKHCMLKTINLGDFFLLHKWSRFLCNVILWNAQNLKTTIFDLVKRVFFFSNWNLVRKKNARFTKSKIVQILCVSQSYVTQKSALKEINFLELGSFHFSISMHKTATFFQPLCQYIPQHAAFQFYKKKKKKVNFLIPFLVILCIGAPQLKLWDSKSHFLLCV